MIPGYISKDYNLNCFLNPKEFFNHFVHKQWKRKWETCISRKYLRKFIRKLHSELSLVLNHYGGLRNYFNILFYQQNTCNGRYVTLKKSFFYKSYILYINMHTYIHTYCNLQLLIGQLKKG